MTKKKIIIIVALLLLFSGASVITGSWLVYRNLIKPMMKSMSRDMPPDLNNAGVRIGAQLLEKETVFNNEHIGLITDIKVTGDESNGWQIGCAHQSGVIYLDQNHQEISSLDFSKRATDVKFLARPDSKDQWFLNRGGHGWADSSLIDPQGKARWSYGSRTSESMSAVNSMAAGVVDNSGQIRFVVGLNGYGGIRMLDQDGKELWHIFEGNVWQVELVDSETKGQKDIIHSNAAGKLMVRDNQGNKLRDLRNGGLFSYSYITKFALCNWPEKKDPAHVLIMSDDKITIMDLNGVHKQKLKAPFGNIFADMQAVNFKFKADEPDYLAILANFSLWDRAVLYIYNPKGEMVYQEVISEETGAISAIPVVGKGVDDLWIGGNSSLWHYRVANK